jgi:hypothetical protein
MGEVTGNAMRMKIELAAMVRKLNLTPAPFTPPALLPPCEGDWIVEGLASPVTVDREFTKFGPHCWMPFKPDIPLLYRHDRPAGRILEIKDAEEGLRVRALVTDNEAKRCSHFSVAATIHSYALRHRDDRARAHAAVSCATLEEVSIVNDPAHPGARIIHRYRQSPAVEFYGIAKAGILKCIEIVEVLQKLAREQADVSQVKHHRPDDRGTPTLGPAAARIYGPIPERPSRPPTQFSALVQQMQEMS